MSNAEVFDGPAFLAYLFRKSGAPSKTQIAVIAGVNASTVGHWGSGKHVPALGVIRRLADKLNVSAIELLAAADFLTDDELGSWAGGPLDARATPAIDQAIDALDEGSSERRIYENARSLVNELRAQGKIVSKVTRRRT